MTEMKRYSVGIDLGTSNTVLAYAPAGSQEIRVFEIEQLVSPGEVAARPLLPSVRYHAAPGELDAGDLQLPWGVSSTDHLDAPVEVAARTAVRVGQHRLDGRAAHTHRLQQPLEDHGERLPVRHQLSG